MNSRDDGSKTILVVDDTPANLEVIMEVLSAAGYVVWTAISGDRALKQLQTDLPTLILLDIQMPEMDGFETCRRIKANPETANIPIIFITAFSDTEKITTGFSLGGVDYITKPLKKAELLARVRTHLQLHTLTQKLEQRVLERTAELQTLEARQRKLFETSPIGLVLCRMDGAIVDANATFAAIIGRTISETLTLTYWDITPDTYDDDEQRQLESLATTGRYGPYEKDYLHKDGHWVPVRLSGLILEQNGEKFIWSSVEDISDRKAVEDSLQQRETQFRNLVSNIDGVVYRCLNDADWSMLFLSDAVEELTGYPAAEFINGQLTFASLIHPDDTAYTVTVVSKALAHQSPFTLEYRIIDRDGRIRWVYERGKGIFDDHGGFQFLEGVILDTSDRKQYETALQNLVAGTAATTGQDFFPALVQHIAEALDVSYVVVSEQVSSANQILALWSDGLLHPNQRYELQQTPCEQVLKTGEYYCPKSLKTHFPKASILTNMEAESYLGFALRDAQGDIIGNLCILDRQPLPDLRRAKQVLHIFTARAAAELERQRVQTSLETLNQELETKVAERTVELQTSRAYYQGIISDQTELICRFLPDGTLTFVNDAYCHFFQTEAEALLGQAFHFSKSGIKPEPADLNDGLTTTNVVATYEHQTTASDGTLYWHQWTRRALFDAEDRFLEFQAVGRDITALKQAESLIQRHLDTIEASIDGLGILRNGRYVFLNQSQLDLFGYNHPDDLLGQPWQTLYNAEEIHRFEQKIFPQVHQHGYWRGEATGKRLDGNLFPVEVSLTLTPTGDIIRVCRDISDRKQAEEQIRQSMVQLEASNNELESFAYSISHDLRAPLRAINGFSQALVEDYGNLFDEDGQYFFDRIKANANRMADLIDDLLRLSRVSRSELNYTAVDLSLLAQEILHDLHTSEPERQVESIVQPGLTVSADTSLMQVVLMNLLQNAWKFTSHHSTACIEFGVLQSDAQENFETVYFIKDDGAGFDMTYGHKLFGVFQRLHNFEEFPGTGIGLASVQRAIHRHGGRVWADASVEQGATFFFTVPSNLLLTSTGE